MTKDDWLEVCGKCLADHGTTNFSALEICDVGRRSGGAVLSAPPMVLLENAYKLIDVLEWLRTKDGTASVLVNSWYRDDWYNKTIGGVKRSMHLTLGAADIVKVGRSPSEVAGLLETSPYNNLLGVGRYKTFTHLDVRGMIGRPSPARWGQA
jgi:hypothetical protein